MENSAKITSCVGKNLKYLLLVPKSVICTATVAFTDKCEEVTIGKKLANNSPLQFKQLFKTFLKKRTTSSFFLVSPTVNEIVELICSLNVNKAIGNDNISTFFLKTAPFVIANYLGVFVKFSLVNQNSP